MPKPFHFIGNEFDERSVKLFQEEQLFVRCKFNNIIAEGANLIWSIFMECDFVKMDIYWCQAYKSNFVKCKFINCDLRGNFGSSWFIECTFENCEYGKNNLGGETEWDQAMAIDCEVNGPPLPIAQIER